MANEVKARVTFLSPVKAGIGQESSRGTQCKLHLELVRMLSIKPIPFPSKGNAEGRVCSVGMPGAHGVGEGGEKMS